MSPVSIVDYQPSHRARFKEINVQWITRKYEMEAEDIRTVDDPQGYVIDGGGYIFIALKDNYPVGTCAYLRMEENVYEMIKMAVDEDYRGLGIGRSLAAESIRIMKDRGAKKIILFSNREGSARAIELYRKLGFRETQLGISEFQRADIRMEMRFAEKKN
jgi:ribosomal protein S18 acetylase RimI-like enzyme